MLEKVNDSSLAKPLPLKIEAYESTLIHAREEIRKFIKTSEGLVFSKIGVDAIIGIIPVVGGIYTFLAGLWLLTQCIKVKAGFENIIMITTLTTADIIIGILVAAGDVIDAFLRVHAWNGNRLISHIDTQLLIIERTREKLNSEVFVNMDEVEDILFRHGKTKSQQYCQYLVIFLVTSLIFIGCSTILY